MTMPHHRCRLYLIASSGTDALTPESLERALKKNDVACVLLTAAPQRPYDLAFARQIMDTVHAHDAAFLIENDFEVAAALGADGLHIDADPELYEAARAALGSDVQIGVACGHSRHLAMQFGEKKADYIAFGERGDGSNLNSGDTTNLIAWWAELFEPPCVAWHIVTADEVRNCAENGADFVAVGDELWLHHDAQLEILTQ